MSSVCYRMRCRNYPFLALFWAAALVPPQASSTDWPQWRGPDRNGDYIVLNVLSYDGGRQLSYEESEAMIDESLQNQKSEKALNEMLGRLQKRYEVSMRPELVMLVKLVDPSVE